MWTQETNIHALRGIQSAIPETKRLQTYALNRAVNGSTFSNIKSVVIIRDKLSVTNIRYLMDIMEEKSSLETNSCIDCQKISGILKKIEWIFSCPQEIVSGPCSPSHNSSSHFHIILILDPFQYYPEIYNSASKTSVVPENTPMFVKVYTHSLYNNNLGSWCSSISTVSDYRLDDQSSISNKGTKFFLKPLCPDQLWGPPNLLSNM
jgi:hypothetical protein